MKNKHSTSNLPLIGWREYLNLPQLGIEKVKAKIDTGARTSALHAFNVKTINQENKTWVNFEVHPIQRNSQITVNCLAPLLEYREVKNSGGHAQNRPVILTEIKLGQYLWEIELTLTNRDLMGFRMLLGRQAIRKRFLVETGRSYFYR
jgi:hypothetical protein